MYLHVGLWVNSELRLLLRSSNAKPRKLSNLKSTSEFSNGNDVARDWRARLLLTETRRVSGVNLRCSELFTTTRRPSLRGQMAADPITADAAAELLNYDLSDDDPFNDNPPRPSRDDKAMLSPRGTKRKTGDEEGNALGLDEEVKITKKRKPAVKLDEARYDLPRLVSDAC